MSEAIATIPDMTPTLERLVQLKTNATTALGTLEYVDTLWTTTVDATRRPGDIERCAALLDELVTEVATTRALQRPQEPAGSPNNPTPAPAQAPTPQTSAHAH